MYERHGIQHFICSCAVHLHHVLHAFQYTRLADSIVLQSVIFAIAQAFWLSQTLSAAKLAWARVFRPFYASKQITGISSK